MYPYGFATVIGTRVSISWYRLGCDYDDILSRTLSIPGAGKSSGKKYLNQLQMNTRPHQQLDTHTSSHIRNFSTRLMATCTMTLFIYRFLFLTPEFYLPSPLYFFFFRRDPQSFSTSCQWGELSR